MKTWAALVTVLLTAAWAASMVRAETASPLVGMTFTHTRIDPAECNLSLTRTGIVDTYHQPGVRRLVRAQLADMRRAGLRSIRILLWFQTDTTGHQWGTIPSREGRLSEPWRSNLIRFASDIRAAGFERFTVAPGPQWSNDPVGSYGPTGLVDDPWDPTKLEENWGFIRDARILVGQYGPAVSVFDVFSEGATSSWASNIPRLESYTTEIWGRYVREFGADDATISVIAKGGPEAASDRMRNLVRLLRTSSLPLPGWFEIHPDFDGPRVLAELRAIDSTLRDLGLSQPLVLGEMSYENSSVAAAVAEFIRTSSRPVVEVYEWPSTVEGGSCPSAPYRADVYLKALTGVDAAPPPAIKLAPIPIIRGTVDAKGRAHLVTATGSPVRELDAGAYRVVVTDRSRRTGFAIVGEDVVVQTGTRAVGTLTLTVEIGTDAPYGSTLQWGATPLRRSAQRFVVH